MKFAKDIPYNCSKKTDFDLINFFLHISLRSLGGITVATMAEEQLWIGRPFRYAFAATDFEGAHFYAISRHGSATAFGDTPHCWFKKSALLQ